MSRRKFSPFEKAFIQGRAGHCCEYCKFPMAYSHDDFHIEHIIPIYFKGSSDLINLAWSCDGCNSNKWRYVEGFDVETNMYAPLFNPRQDVWKNHFQWNEDFTMIVGLTATGRATVDLLKMNRLGLVNIHKVLFAYGVKPT